MGIPSRFLRSFLAVLLSVSIAAPMPLLAQGSTRSRANVPDINLVGNAFSYSRMFEGDPIAEEFIRASWANMPSYGPFDRNDKILDQDPYFMRTQSWVGATATQEIRARSVNDGVVIDIPGAHRSLRINQPLRPVFVHEDFYFFQGSDRLFADRANGSNDVGQGLFFIDKRDLLAEAQKTSGPVRRIPIFFLPMPYDGWTGTISGLHDADLDEIHLRNGAGNSVGIETLDLYKLSQVYHFNLILTTSMVLRHESRALYTNMQRAWSAKAQAFELPDVLPPVGSTAVFGSYVTGLDLENPSRSISPVAETKFEKLWKKLGLVENASASDLLSPDVLQRLQFVGQVLAAVYVTSIAAKYTILKDRNTERRALIESREASNRVLRAQRTRERAQEATSRGRTRQAARLEQRAGRQEQPPADNMLSRATRELREQIDFLSHGLATVSAGLNTLTGFALEFGADKFLGRQGRSPNGMVRKFLEYTFLYGRKQNENIAANWNTFFLGAVVLGGIDTAGVVVQLTAVSPVFFPWVAGAFGEQMQTRVSHQFSGEDTTNNNNITSEIMRNFTGYTLAGAYSYSSEQRQALLEIVRPEIEAQMRREGKNPVNPANHQELERRIERRLEAMLVERGLPSRDEFLFSSPSAIRGIAQLMGFRVDRSRLSEGQREHTFALENARWGLTTNAIKKALHAARELHATHRDPKTAAAVEILEKTLREQRLVRSVLRRPHRAAEAIAQAKKTRQMLTMLTYNGPIIGQGIQFIDHWDAAKTQPQAAALAGMLFRQSFFSLTQDKPFYLQPSQAQLNRYLPEARIEARTRLQELHRQVLEAGPNLGSIESADQALASLEADVEILALEIVKEKIENAANQVEVASYRPRRMDWLEKWQMAQADRKARRAVAERLGARATLDLTGEESSRIYREAYREALSRIVGVHADTIENSELVRRSVEQAQADLNSDLSGNEGLAIYLESLTPQEKTKFLAHRYADAFLSHYAENSVSNSNIVSLTSSEQLGRFQALRRTKLVSGTGVFSRFLLTTLRLAESPMDATASFRPGLGAFFKRNVPWYQDFTSQLTVKMRGITAAATTGFLGAHYIWQVRFDWPTYIFFFATGAFVAVASNWLSRMMMNINIRPMHDIGSKVVYSSIYTWLTYPTFIPFFFYYEDFNRAFHQYVALPVANAATQVATTVGPFCEAIFK